MGIYINMKMPEGERGAVPVIIFADGAVRHYFSRVKLGTAVPILPNSRLIDANALEAVIEQHYKHLKISRYDRDLLLHYLDVEMSPTIIPAEGVKT